MGLVFVAQAIITRVSYIFFSIFLYELLYQNINFFYLFPAAFCLEGVSGFGMTMYNTYIYRESECVLLFVCCPFLLF